MSYTYRNVKTKEIITTSNKVSGKNWEPIGETALNSADSVFEDDSILNDSTEDDSTEEEIVEDKAPVGKPKRTRRSNR